MTAIFMYEDTPVYKLQSQQCCISAKTNNINEESPTGDKLTILILNLL